MSFDISTTITIEGEEYDARLAKIERADLGWEDHGIFTAYLTFTWNGGGQSEPARDWGPAALKFYLEEVMRTLGVFDWSQVVGREVYILNDKDRFIKGIAHPTEKRFMFFDRVKEMANAYENEKRDAVRQEVLAELQARTDAEAVS